MTSKKLTTRPIADEDIPFLKQVYASTRDDEMKLTGWPKEQIDRFIDMQFEAQHKYYQEMFPRAHYSLILLEDRPVGRLYLDRREDEHRIVDIALLPEYRGRGFGSRLLRDLLAEAATASKTVRIHVEHNNPALHLYRRLGFKRVDDHGVYYLMEWRPTSRPGDAPQPKIRD